ncbi:hypothetical protein GGR51DRAFT_519884 [Nemania sp. FL0031]|nr:hypothetical protein GGR51DRAFT_519884 [Nemania sp. FL0031]
MAAVSASFELDIGGLHRAPNRADLEMSSNAYNRIPDEGEQPNVADRHLRELGELFERHGVVSKFGLHLIHGHFGIAADKIMMGKAIEGDLGYWTKPTSIHDVDLQNIHGHIFAMSDSDNFVAYEYREGPPVEFTVDDAVFIRELVQYLLSNKLNKLLGLQVLSPDDEFDGKQMLEFILGPSQGTVMLHEDKANHGGIYRVTGWRARVQDGITSFSEGNADSHAETTRGTHQVFQGKGEPDLPDDSASKDCLKLEGLWNGK